jgi:NAD(P)-dependent dehydrogenase (short-subunit alcohol dehydrogenase family)
VQPASQPSEASRPSDPPATAGKTVLITGGTRGIGRMLACRLAADGAFVEIVGRSRDALDETIAELGPDRGAAIQADIATEEGLDAVVAAVAGRHDRLDVLINNAATSRFSPLDSTDHSLATWDKVLRLNVAAPFLLTVRLLPLLTKGWTIGDPRRRVINIGSIDGMRAPEHDAFAYAASKAALHHLTEMLAPKLAPRGVLVNALALSAFETWLSTERLGGKTELMAAVNPLDRLGGPDDIAGAVAFLMSEQSAFVNGAVIPVDGGTRNRTVPFSSMSRELDRDQFLRIIRDEP